jgi:H+/Cl- antiporter ClcA
VNEQRDTSAEAFSAATAGLSSDDGSRFQANEAGAQFRMVLVSFLAAGIGLVAGVVAYILYNLIALLTNLVFYHDWSFTFRSARNTHLGWWIVIMPALGGVIVGIMARFGTSKIRGHGIPEAMEAVLVNRSRI